MTIGVYPGAVFYGDTQGCYGAICQNEPRIFVDHIMVGHKTTLDSAWRFENGVCVTFGIGRDGSVSQYRSIFQSHWGNGIHNPREPAIVNNPFVQPWLSKLTPRRNEQGWHYVDSVTGANWLNTHSISFEHEGFPDDVWPEEMVQATIAVKKWCLEEMRRIGNGFSVFEPARLVGHFEIDAVNKANCPGPNWPRDRIVAALMEEKPMTPEEVKEFRELQQLIAYNLAPSIRALQEYNYGVAWGFNVTNERLEKIEGRLGSIERLIQGIADDMAQMRADLEDEGVLS